MNQNEIHYDTMKQNYLVHNGKWNSGACCLVNVVLQRQRQRHNEGECDDDNHSDVNSGCDVEEEEEEYKAILYSSHTGDCRAVLLSGDNNGDNNYHEHGSASASASDGDDLSFHGDSSSDDDSDGDHDGDNKRNRDSDAVGTNTRTVGYRSHHLNAIGGQQDEDENADEKGISMSMSSEPIIANKRPLLNPSNACNQSISQHQNQNRTSRFKRRRLWNQNDVSVLDQDLDLNMVDSPARIQMSAMRQTQTKLPTTYTYGNGNGHGHGNKHTYARICSRSPSPLEINRTSSDINDAGTGTGTGIPKFLRATTLTKDHTPYNHKEASLVRERCGYAERAIATSSNGGIQRVAGSLSVTRALGDAYLKTPKLSFPPYKDHAPYISAMPEVSARILTGDDRILILASDGVWERVDGDKIANWVGDYCHEKKFNVHCSPGSAVTTYQDTSILSRQPRPRRMRMLPTRNSLSSLEHGNTNTGILNMTNCSDMIVAKVLNRVRNKYRIPSLLALMGLPKGTTRRTKHDDITTMVVDLEGFIVMH